MLQVIRSQLNSWFAWVIVIIICCSFALWGIGGYLGGGGAGETLAKVDGVRIGQRQANIAYERLRQRAIMQLGNDFALDEDTVKILKRSALEQLILSQVLTQDALGAGYRVPQQELMRVIYSNPNFQVDGKFSEQRFYEVASRLMYSSTTFLEYLQGILLHEQVHAGLVDSAFLLAEQREHIYDLVKQTRDASLLAVPRKKFIDKVKITKKQQHKYYQENQEKFTIAEKVRIDYIELSAEALGSQLAEQFEEQEADLRQYYEEHKNNYTEPKRWKIAHILTKVGKDADKAAITKARKQAEKLAQQLKKGADFAALAAEHSADIISAKEGGKLAWFDASSEMDEALKQGTKKLSKVGQTSAPIRTAYGFDIIKLLAMKKEEVLAFAEVREQIAQLLARQKAEKQFADSKDTLSDLSYANPDSLAIASKALQLPVQHSDWFNRQGSQDAGLTSDQRIIKTAFSDDVLLQGNNSSLLQLESGVVIVLRVAEHEPAKQLSYAQANDQIHAHLLRQQSYQLAKKTGVAIVAELKKGTAPAVIAKKYQLEWKKYNGLARDNDKLNRTIVANIFNMARPDKENPVSVSASGVTSGDYLVMHLLAVHNVVKDKEDDEYEALGAEVERDLGELDYLSYKAAQMESADISRTEKAS